MRIRGVAMIGVARRRYAGAGKTPRGFGGNTSASISTAYDDDANRLIQAITDLPAGPDIAPTISLRINAPRPHWPTW